MDVEDRIDQAVQTLITLLNDLPNEALYRAPSEGEWPVMSTLAHVVEMLPYWAGQCQLIAAQPGRPFGRSHDDPGRLGGIAAHANDPAQAIRHSIRTSADSAIATLRSIPRERWNASGQHPRRGEMTIDQVVDSFIVQHLDDHVAQVRDALKDLGYSPSQVP